MTLRSKGAWLCVGAAALLIGSPLRALHLSAGKQLFAFQQAAPQSKDAEAPQARKAPPEPPPVFGVVAYPDRPKAPQEVLDRGKAVYSVNCAFCHGSDAGGGSVGPNLLRSNVVLQDKEGEAIMPIVHGARVARGMPRIEISDAQVKDIAAWLHSIPVKSNAGHEKINILVGDKTAGATAFNRLCSSCHSVTGDLNGFAANYSDPREMQQAWLLPSAPAGFPGMGGGAPVQLHVPPVTASVTDAKGTKSEGVLVTVDEFLVTIRLPNGTERTWLRNDGLPKVDVHDPLAPHRELFHTYSDKDIHDITAYLASLK